MPIRPDANVAAAREAASAVLEASPLVDAGVEVIHG
jgi:hypothetical protein